MRVPKQKCEYRTRDVQVKKSVVIYVVRPLNGSPGYVPTTMWIFLLCWGLTISQPLWFILSRLPKRGRKEIAEEMKKRDREERGTGMKVRKQKK